MRWMDENFIYYGLVALALLAIFGIGMARDRATEDAMRRYAERHGMEFRPRELLKGIKAQATGRVRGRQVSIGEAIVDRYTKGIGPTERGVELEARLELPEGASPDPARLQRFLQEGGGTSGRSLLLYFPKRWFSPISYEEIEQAVARLLEAAENAAAK